MKLTKPFKILIASICILLCGHSNAALITFSSTGIYSDFDANQNLLAYFNSKTTVNNATLPDFDMRTTFFNSVMVLDIELNVAQNTLITFLAGIDASEGAEIYVNGAQVFDTTDNLWWDKNWASTDVIQTSSTFATGVNNIKFVWAETCCAGLSSVGFSTQSTDGEIIPISLEELSAFESTPVNAPGNIAILTLGLLLMYRKKTKLA